MSRSGVLRNPYSGLVLEASGSEVKLQHFTGYASQLWKFEPAGPGKHYIVNQGNGGYMDVYGTGQSGDDIIVASHGNSRKQEWYLNSDNTIVSGFDSGLAVDIYQEKYYAGARIILYSKHGGANQRFEFQNE